MTMMNVVLYDELIRDFYILSILNRRNLFRDPFQKGVHIRAWTLTYAEAELARNRLRKECGIV